MKLIIVESQTKVRSIQSYLGKDYKVMASFGNFRDLSTSGPESLGVNITDDFAPDYVIDTRKEKIVTRLKEQAANADEVYLATDPDREGEAISWHLAETLTLDIATTKRLEFHEITKRAIEEAMGNPRTIDMQLVQSQETRRIIDRIIGFRLSKLVQEKIRTASAGRVQSVALKVIVDLEKDRNAFVPQDFLTISGVALKDGQEYDIQLFKFQGKEIRLSPYGQSKWNNYFEEGSIDENKKHHLTQSEAETILTNIDSTLLVESYDNKEKTFHSPAVFTTSTLQQEAFNKLRFPIAKTMKVAQELYEGVSINEKLTGLITYMRTDSDRVSGLFVFMAKEFIQKHYGEEYVGKPKNFATGGQNAHEGIRPVDVNHIPSKIKKSLSEEQYKLYELIWNRAVASMMSGRQARIHTAFLTSKEATFKLQLDETIFDGFTALKKEEKENRSISLKKGEQMEYRLNAPEQQKTKPASRFSEASLIRYLDSEKIGRPSTFATIVGNLKDRKYVEVEKGYLVPTQNGIVTAETLVSNFPDFINVPYTAQMEEKLDEVAVGNQSRSVVLHEFFDDFSKAWEKAKLVEKVPVFVPGDEVCPTCSGRLVYKIGRYGEYIACENYPKTCEFHKAKPKPLPEKIYPCPKCKVGHLIIRKGKFGAFQACSNYPQCDYARSFKKK